MSSFSERQTVQNPFIRYAEEVGWIYLPPEEALRQRGGVESPLLKSVLVKRLQLLNPGVVDSPTKANEVVARLLGVRPDIEGNLEAWEYLKGLKTLFVEAQRRECNLKLLDTQHPHNNCFHVTDEFRFATAQGGTNAIRADVVLLINGIPVIVVETKAATRIEGIAEALDQLRRYHEQAPELMAQAQLLTLTHLVQFFYGPTWSLTRKTLFNWRDEQAGDFETLVKTFLAPGHVLRLLTEYILFVRKDGELTKAVLRAHQMRATEKVVARSKDPHKRRGLIWHTQGSGKTYTMITVAKRLLEDPRLENPTILMIVDRNELQQQLFQNLEAVGFSRVHVAQSKRHLQQLLREDTRGLIVSMIHKFDEADADLNTRSNILVLVDEAHRSTGGDLGNYLMGALPNATFVGFTGTPIDRTAHGQGTFKTFGIDDSQGYLDKYSIRESIADGTTVPLYYQMAPNDLIANAEAMEQEFWAAAELEGVADVEELNRVLDRAVTLKNMLKNRERVEKIASYVAEHFRHYIEPMGYKAFVVAVDREACGLYKQALDRCLPPEMSRVVISRGPSDPPQLSHYHLSDEEEAAVRKAFRKPNEQPKILIVTEKLLTGYDAPILYCMYLDKPMRDHVLLQTIARVNRPYEDETGRRKTNGLIVDFVGIFNRLKQALAFDSEDVNGVVEGLEVLQEHFKALMERGRNEFLPLSVGKTADKAAEAVLEHFRDRQRRETFYAYFRELEESYEILSPDPFLRPFLEDYQALVAMYQLLRSAYEPHVPIDRSFLRKTAAIVQRHTATNAVRDPYETYQLGAPALLQLLAKPQPDTVKVFNLLKELHKLVADQGRGQPHLIPIGERTEAIRHAFEEQQINSQEALKELSQLVHDLQTAQEQCHETNLSPEAFAVAWWLRVQKNFNADRAEQLAAAVQPIFHQFPHWATSPAQERDLRKQLYRVLIAAGETDPVTWANEMLQLLRRATQ